MKKLGKAASDLVSGDDFEEENVISNPDNLVVMRDKRVIIGEDTSNEGHANDNMIWMYTPEGC
jgi:secreted PhoX family phosphatase